MSRLRVPLTGLREGLTQLEGEAAHYVATVRRLRRGDRFVAFDPEHGTQAEAVVVRSHRGRVLCEIAQVQIDPEPPRAPLCLLLGLSKHDCFERAIREATALGVTKLVPVECARSALRAKEVTPERTQRWRRILVEGAKQSGRADIPTLASVCSLSTALRSEATKGMLCVCCWERSKGSVNLLHLDTRGADGVVVLVGPEGGLEPAEVRLASESGWQRASLSRLTLRTETAVVVALGTLQLMRQEHMERDALES